MKGAIREAYYKEQLHEDHSNNLKELLVTRHLQKEHQDFIQGKQVVNTFVGALYIAIEELLLELIRQVLQLLKVKLILHNFDHLDHHNQEHLVHHYSMENSVVKGSNYHFNRESVDYKLAS